MHQIWAEGEWVTWVIWCFAKRTVHKTWCTSVWWSCQSPAAHSCGLLNQWNSFHGGMLKLNAKSDADLSLYPLSHCECDCHTVHMLTQQRLPPPLTSTVKSSLLTLVHSNPLSSAARLHRCHANRSGYINNGQTFSGQISYNYVECAILDNDNKELCCWLMYLLHFLSSF